MEISRIHRITALAMSFLMFISSLGYSVDLHFCNGDLKSFNVLGEASNCHESKTKCPRHVQMNVDDSKNVSNCCSNRTVEIDELDSDYNFSTQPKLTDLQIKIVLAYAITHLKITTPIAKNSISQKTNVLPPTRDIYVLFERFLI